MCCRVEAPPNFDRARCFGCSGLPCFANGALLHSVHAQVDILLVVIRFLIIFAKLAAIQVAACCVFGDDVMLEDVAPSDKVALLHSVHNSGPEEKFKVLIVIFNDPRRFCLESR